MAKIELTIGAGLRYTWGAASGLVWSRNDLGSTTANLLNQPPLPPALFENPNLSDEQRKINLLHFGPAGSFIDATFRVGTTWQTTVELTTVAEQADQLLTIQAPGWGPYILPGPNSSLARLKDATTRTKHTQHLSLIHI